MGYMNPRNYNGCCGQAQPMPQPMPVRRDCGMVAPENRSICNTNAYENTCMPQMEPVDRMPLTMCYVPWQSWDGVYEMQKALQTGTIFPSMDKAFQGRRGNR